MCGTDWSFGKAWRLRNAQTTLCSTKNTSAGVYNMLVNMAGPWATLFLHTYITLWPEGGTLSARITLSWECSPNISCKHSNTLDNVDHTSSGGSASLIHFQQPSESGSPHHPDDDVDLEALVNDMTSLSPYEGLYSFKTQHSDTVPLLHNGQGTGVQSNSRAKANHSAAQKACRSQPVHILAVRRLQQEEQQVRPASLPAIPNPFPELCSPAGSPILNAGSMPQPSDVHKIS